ncbi:MAG: hypothetical protein ACREFK_13020 [Stellaceae bacterium]
MSARFYAWVLALTLAAGAAQAAGMPAYGTKNFAPSPATPSYFTGERGVPYAGPQGGPAPRAFRSQYSTAATAARASGDLYARPTRPATETAMHRRWTRPVHARSRYWQSRAGRARRLRPARLHRLRTVRTHRRQSVRLARARPRYKRTWRR